MKIKRFNILILLIVLISVSLSSCSQKSPYFYEYPENYTVSYCMNNYELFDPNIKYTECYDILYRPTHFLFRDLELALQNTNFSAIKGIEDLNFMVLYREVIYLGKLCYVDVVRKKNTDINPAVDFTPATVELCWYAHGDERVIDAEDEEIGYYQYASTCFSDSIMTIDNEYAIAEIMEVARRKTIMSYSEEDSERDKPECMSDSSLDCIHNPGVRGELAIRISFEETDGLILIGQIFVDDMGKTYMKHDVYTQESGTVKMSGGSVPRIFHLYYRLGENMDAIISELIEELSGS